MNNQQYLFNTKRIFLARHGESVANQEKLLSGQLEFPLTDKGKYQAQWLCDVLKNNKLSAIYTSSLTRAVETARPTAEYHKLDIQTLDDLKEIHFGVLQGKAANELDAEAQALWMACESDMDFTIPGGESFRAFQHRILDCLEALLQAMPDNSLIVAHRNTNEVILSKLLGLDSTNDKGINVKNKYLYEIQLDALPSVNTIRLGGEFHGKKFVGLKDE
ncbi:fructose-2,6-bisphosphatase [Methyloglobulus morosus KoM1]|uniref:Fructose-2,6-bisphosphatase n=1 Tax=Methyloglobulus morosus KoM1 TaxID=1116472 RepID=V5DJK1_9GAMM|nr:histidine phosphatase family protein [Methyloglobulus morosus]ESS67576.1 fructose-2,6-bisphosphatase [Methyloglobulus morosus KoM1]